MFDVIFVIGGMELLPALAILAILVMLVLKIWLSFSWFWFLIPAGALLVSGIFWAWLNNWKTPK